MRRWPALLAGVVLVVAGLDTAVAVGRVAGTTDAASRPAVHAEATRSATGAAAAAVARLLQQRAAAVSSRDLAAYTALLDPTVPTFVSAQRAQFVAMVQLPLTAVSYRADPASAAGRGRVAGYGGLATYAPTVALSYELAGFYDRPVTATEVDTFVDRGGRWLLASDTDFGAPSPQIWQYGPIQVVRGARSLVVAQPGTVTAARAVAAEVDRDIPAVSAVWGTDWSQRAVVLMPATQADLAALVGASGDLSQIAAAESAELGQDQQAGARILVNPTPYAGLSPLGRQVVITHELTHVASRLSTTTSTPLWLVEGLADYVGFLRTGLGPATVAAELDARLRAGVTLTALPDDASFRADAPHLDAQYQQAWLACRLIAARIGPAGLVAFYREVGAPGHPPASAGATGTGPAAAVDEALRDRLHEDTAAFTRDWIAYVHEQLSP